MEGTMWKGVESPQMIAGVGTENSAWLKHLLCREVIGDMVGNIAWSHNQ